MSLSNWAQSQYIVAINWTPMTNSNRKCIKWTSRKKEEKGNMLSTLEIKLLHCPQTFAMWLK